LTATYVDHVTRNDDVREMLKEAVVAYVCTYELRICQRTCVDKRGVEPEWPVSVSSFISGTTRTWIWCVNFHTFMFVVSTRMTHALYPKCDHSCLTDMYS